MIGTFVFLNHTLYERTKSLRFIVLSVGHQRSYRMSAIDEVLAAHFRKQKDIHGAHCKWCGANESITKLRWNGKEGVIECIPENEVECIARCKEKANYKKWEHFVPSSREVYI